MILYYFEHPSQLFKVLIHKKIFNEAEEAILLVADISYDFEPVERLREQYMQDFGFIKMAVFPHTYNWISAPDSDEYKKKILIKYNELFEKNNIDVGQAKKIYISRDSGVGLETYCLINGYKYIHFETIKGTAARHIGGENKGMHALYNLMLEETLGQNLIKQVVSTSGEIVKHKFADEWIYFDYIRAFQSFDPQEKNVFFQIYNTAGIPHIENACLYFPNSSYNIRVSRNMHTKYAYLANELLMDYYFDDSNIILKPHPLFDFELHKKDTIIQKIPSSIPSEMLRFIPGFKIDKAISVASSAVYDLKDCTNEIVFFGWGYNGFFLILHRFFVLSKLFEFLCEKDKKFFGEQFEIGYTGMFGDQLEFFKKNALRSEKISAINIVRFNNLKLKKVVILYVDKKEENHNQNEQLCQFLEALPNNTIVGFIIKDDYIPFVSSKYKHLLQYIVPVLIKKKNIRQSIHSDLDNETVFIFCKNRNTREYVDDFRLVKNLDCAGLQICVEPLSGFERQNINLQLKLALLEEDNQILKDELSKQQDKQQKLLSGFAEILELNN